MVARRGEGVKIVFRYRIKRKWLGGWKREARRGVYRQRRGFHLAHDLGDLLSEMAGGRSGEHERIKKGFRWEIPFASFQRENWKEKEEERIVRERKEKEKEKRKKIKSSEEDKKEKASAKKERKKRKKRKRRNERRLRKEDERKKSDEIAGKKRGAIIRKED